MQGEELWRGAHPPVWGCAPLSLGVRTLQCGGAHPPLLWGCALPFVHNDEFSSTLMEQRTLDAIGVLIISTTAGGGVLGRLRCNVDSEGGKYTSATPRCTCLPPRQHCAEVALGAFTTDSSAMLTRREASTPRLRLGVLASLLVNIALKLHSEESKYTSATPRCTCFPPRATSTQVPLVQVQVPKSNSASPRWTWGLGLGLGGLERSRSSPPPPAVGLVP